jgi:hypothetical protein
MKDENDVIKFIEDLTNLNDYNTITKGIQKINIKLF